MVYYHVFVKYKNKEGVLEDAVLFNFPKKKVRQTFAVPFMKNKPILVRGKFVHPSNIERIRIFESDVSFQRLILPNNKSPIDEKDNDYVADCFGKKKVKFRVRTCTHDFITSPPREEEPIKTAIKLGKKETIFIVHGRDEKQALRLQKYLTKNLKLNAEMFEDFKEESGSKTIIEQLEFIKDSVSYAFVIVTPDDVGCLHEDIDKCRTKMLIGKETIEVQTVCDILDKLHTRARQNVVFEHGLFIGALGRDRVCCLLQEDTKEKPSDIDGILYVGFKKSVKETFTEITEKLKKAGLIKT